MHKLEEMTIQELTDLYNNQPGVKKISKFRDKATGIKRLIGITPKESVNIETILTPNKDLYPCRVGTKVATAIDMLYKGATESELLNFLGSTKKTKPTKAKFNHWLRWNIHKDKGYGISIKKEDGKDKYYLTMPKDGMMPVPHTPRKPKKETPTKQEKSDGNIPK